MNRLIVALILSALTLSGCSLFRANPSNDIGNDFETRVARYSEELFFEPTPTSDSSVPIIVGSGGCEVNDGLRDEFDSLVPLSDSARRAAEAEHAKFGLPIDTLIVDTNVHLYHDRYIIAYNPDLKIPVIASYVLGANDLVKGGVRKECFREDHRLNESERSRLIDYDFSITGFDRGHMVPDADLQSMQSDAINSYFMSNMSPQHHTFNRGAWRLLEASVRLWADERKEIHVISGAIFDRDENGERDADEDAERAPPTRNVAVATAFYKIILAENADGKLEAIAFILPHSFTSTAPNVPYIEENIVSIDKIESITGYDFFPELNDAVERQLESIASPDLWCRRRCN